MNALSGMPFWKMNGLGNDFVVLDARGAKPAVSRDAVRRIADRKSGIGCDQLIVMVPSDGADVRMRIWNRDGEEVESCGNASRCVVALTGVRPRWRQAIGTAANRGVLCFGANRGRNVTYTNSHRWLPGFRPDDGDAALRRFRLNLFH